MRVVIRGRWERFGVHDSDVVVAVALLVFSVLSVATKAPATDQRGGDAITYVLVAVGTAPFVVHRRYPLSALAVTVGVFLALAAMHTAFYPGLQLFVLLGAIALHADRRRSLLAFVVAMAAMLVGLLLQPAGVATTADWTSSLLATAVAWLGGEYLRSRRARWSVLEERSALLERERLVRDGQAVLAERLRIARELHDVVAHSMSVIAIQSGAAHHLLDTNPSEAAAALTQVETTSRQAMTEMRQLVGVLRDADGQLDPTTPAPGLDDLPALFTELRAAGLGVDYRVQGSPIDVPAAVGMSTYRIVQEALTNVIKHGGPVATVTIRADAAAMHVDVHDNGAPAGSRRALSDTDALPGGHGLVGMRERVSVFGGQLTAGPRPGGGFGVTAILPVGGVEVCDRRTPGPTSHQSTDGEMVST